MTIRPSPPCSRSGYISPDKRDSACRAGTSRPHRCGSCAKRAGEAGTSAASSPHYRAHTGIGDTAATQKQSGRLRARGGPGVPTSYRCERLAGRRSTALIHRCRPSTPRTRPNHSRVDGAPSPTNQAAQPWTTWPSPPGPADQLHGGLLRCIGSDRNPYPIRTCRRFWRKRATREARPVRARLIWPCAAVAGENLAALVGASG